MAKMALLIIDMLNDFLYKDYNPSLACERGLVIIPRVRKLAQLAIDHGLPVIYSSDAHLPGDSELKRWGEHAMQGTGGSKVIPELPTDGAYSLLRNEKLDPSKAEGKKLFIVEKGAYSGFYETPLDELLRLLGVDTLYLTGLHTNICDRHTAADAFFRGYKIVTVTDGVEAFDEEQHKSGLEYLEYVYSAGLKNAGEVADDFVKAT